MNKIVTLITALILAISASAHPNIQDTFFGCTIGKSNYNEVIRELKKRGIQYDRSIANAIFAYDVQFGGSTWDYCAFNFNSDGVLYLFVVDYSAPREIIDPFRDDVLRKLFQKYGNTPDGYGDDKKYLSFYWQDFINVLWVFYRNSGADGAISLFYSNDATADVTSDF